MKKIVLAITLVLGTLVSNAQNEVPNLKTFEDYQTIFLYFSIQILYLLHVQLFLILLVYYQMMLEMMVLVII